MTSKIPSLFLLILSAVLIQGCASSKNSLELENELLKGRITRLERQHEDDLRRLEREKNRELSALEASREQVVRKASDLENSRDELARRLAKEISDYQAKLELSERGLVITFLQEILFDSGKAEVKPEGLKILSKVAKVVQNEAKEYPLVVEGHTDNVPIRVSGWKSNWELSAARALSVLHQFVELEGVDPSRLAVMGYGEYRPVSSNQSDEGRRQNRRVEIVIFPEKMTKVAR